MGSSLKNIRYEASGSSKSNVGVDNAGAIVGMYIASRSNRTEPKNFINISSSQQFVQNFADSVQHPTCVKALNLLDAGYQLKVNNVYSSKYRPTLRFFPDITASFEYGANYPQTDFGFVNIPDSVVRLDLSNVKQGDYCILEPKSELQNNLFLYFYEGEENKNTFPTDFSMQNIYSFEDSKFDIKDNWAARDVIVYLNEKLAGGYYAVLGENSNIIYISSNLGFKNIGNSSLPFEFSENYLQYFNIINRDEDKIFDLISPYKTDNDDEFCVSVSLVDGTSIYRIKVAHMSDGVELQSETFVGQLNSLGPVYPNVLFELMQCSIVQTNVYQTSPTSLPLGTFFLKKPCNSTVDCFLDVRDKTFASVAAGCDSESAGEIDIFYDSGIVNTSFQKSIHNLFSPRNTLCIFTQNPDIESVLDFSAFFTNDAIVQDGVEKSAAEIYLENLLQLKIQGIVDDVDDFVQGTSYSSDFHVNKLVNMTEVYYTEVLGYYSSLYLVDARELLVKPLLDRRITNYWNGSISSVQTAILEVVNTMKNKYGIDVDISLSDYDTSGDTIKIVVLTKFNNIQLLDSLILNLQA